jgi:hypothetical protein
MDTYPQSNQLPWETPEFGGASLAEFRPTPESVSSPRGPADAGSGFAGQSESAPNSVKLTKGNVPPDPIRMQWRGDFAQSRSRLTTECHLTVSL